MTSSYSKHFFVNEFFSYTAVVKSGNHVPDVNYRPGYPIARHTHDAYHKCPQCWLRLPQRATRPRRSVVTKLSPFLVPRERRNDAAKDAALYAAYMACVRPMPIRHKRTYDKSDLAQQRLFYEVLPPKQRDVLLALRLRSVIKAKRAQRVKQWKLSTHRVRKYMRGVKMCAKLPTLCGNGEMPFAQEVESGEDASVRHGDTIYTTHDSPDVVTDGSLGYEPASLSSNDAPTRVTKMTLRGAPFANINWDSTKTAGQLLAEYTLPKDIIKANLLSPQFVPFSVHGFYRYEYIEIEALLNASRFSIAQCQLSVYYDSFCDSQKKFRNNMFNRSQLPHVLLDAGSSNNAVLRIPYKHYNPWISIEKALSSSAIHDLQLRVLYPYTVPTGGPPSCNITLIATFVGAEFIGFRSAALVALEAQMFPMAAGMLMQYLNQSKADRNRDKPPLQLNAPPLEPRTTGCLATGTGTGEPVQSLRLDARGQTPHMLESDFPSTMEELAQNMGLYTAFSWKIDQQAGTLLWDADAAPLQKLTAYSKRTVQDTPKLEAYSIPPCGVVASMYNIYSGSVKFRLDFIGSFAHTGSVLMAFVPGYCSDTTPSYEQARMGYHVVFDIHTTRSFEFVCPYVADKPFWPVRRLDVEDENDMPCFGRVFLYVLNPLCSMANVPQEIRVMVYTGAGPDMRFAVPVQPQLTLPWDLETLTPPVDHTVRARDGYYPFYVGTWRWLEGGSLGGVLRYGPVSDHIAQFSLLKQGVGKKWVYYTTTSTATFRTSHDGKVVPWSECIFIPLDVNDGYGLIYMACVRALDKHLVLDHEYKKGATPNWSALTWYAIDDAFATYCTGNPLFVEATFMPPPRRLRTASSSFEDLTRVGRTEMDGRQDAREIMQPVGVLPFNRVQRMYGEGFSDVKDMLRRYELVTSVPVKYNATPHPNQVMFSIPVMPQGLQLDINESLTSALGRQGMHGLILAAARFGYGSMNLKFVSYANNGMLWVQHHPEDILERPTVGLYGKSLSDSAYMHGYGSAVSDRNINSTLTVNVPYYLPNQLMLLQRPDTTQSANVRQAMSLGSIVGGVNYTKYDQDQQERIQVYGAVGDDFSPHSYVGWPEVIPRYVFDSYQASGNAEMFKVNVTHNLEDSQFGILVDHITKSFNNGVGRFCEKLGDGSKTVVHLAGLFATALASKSKASWAVASAAALIELKVFEGVNLGSAIDAIRSAISTSEPQPSKDNIAPSGCGEMAGPKEEDLESWSKFAALAWQGIALGLGMQHGKKPESMHDWAMKFSHVMKGEAMATRGFLAFFKNLFDVISEMVAAVVMWWKPELRTLSDLKVGGIMVDQFNAECCELRTMFEKNIPQDQNFANRLEAACVVADELLKMVLSNPQFFPPQIFQIISQNIKYVHEKRCEFLKRGLTSVTRYNPFCLWLWGMPGLGKSELTTRLVSEIVSAMGIKSDTPYFCKPASASYFTGAKPQNGIIGFDDFGQYEHSDSSVSDAAIFIHLKSSAPYNPPMAAIEDKPLLLAPKALLCMSNSGWPSFNAIKTREALWRRRDLVVKVQFKAGVTSHPVLDEQNPKVTFDHLDYFICDALKPEQTPKGPYGFATMLSILNASVKAYDKKESVMLDHRLANLKSTYTSDISADTVKTKINLSVLEMADKINCDFEVKKKMCGEEMFNKALSYTKRAMTWGMPAKVKPDHFKNIAEVLKSEKEASTGVTTVSAVQDLLGELKMSHANDITEESTSSGVAEPEPLDYEKLIAESLSACGAADPVVMDSTDVEVSGSGEMAPAKKTVPVDQITVHKAGGEVEIGTELTQPPGTLNAYWHVAFGTKACAHSPRTFIYRYRKIEGNTVTVSSGDTYSLKKCESYCISNEQWFQRAFGTKKDATDYATLLSYCHQSGIYKESVFYTPKPAFCFKKFIADLFKRTVTGLCKAIKYVFWILITVAAILIPALAFIAMIMGITTGMRGISRYYSDKRESFNDTSLKTAVYDEWKNYNRDLYTELAPQSWRYPRHCPKGTKPSSGRYYAKDFSWKEEDGDKYCPDLDAWGIDYSWVNNSIIDIDRNCYEWESSPYEVKQPRVSGRSGVTRAILKGESSPGVDITHCIKKNTVFFSVTGIHKTTGAQITASGRGFGIKDQYVLIPRHYLAEWDVMRDRVMEVRTMGMTKPLVVLYNSISILMFQMRELTLIRIPKLSPMKDMIKHLASEKSWDSPLSSEVTYTEVRNEFDANIKTSPCRLMHEFKLKIDDVDCAVLPDVIQYDLHGRGCCMVVLQDRTGKIVGFHIAGDGKKGYAEPIVKESFLFLYDKIIKEFQPVEEVISVGGAPEMANLQLDTQIIPLARAAREHTRHETGKTSIVPSGVFGVFPQTTKPVPLVACKDNNFSDPLMHGCRKHGLLDLGFPSRPLREAAEGLRDMLKSVVLPPYESVRVWSVQDAINGVPSTAGFGRVVMKTSEGFPYVFERPGTVTGKTWLLNPGEILDTWTYKLHPRLLTIMEEKQQLRLSGIVPATIFIDCLKDERIVLEKVNQPGKARIFSVAPLDYLIHFRQYFADFMIGFTRAFLDANHAIGIAPETMDWTTLARNLQSKGPKILCGDYKNFGPAFANEVSVCVNECILAWYEEHDHTPTKSENQKIRACLMAESTFAIHLAHDLVYQVMCGQPSGAPDTTMRNSLVNFLYVYTAWRSIWSRHDPKMVPMDRFKYYVWFTTYGDDVIMNVSDEVIDTFNNVSLQEFFGGIGVTYTDDQKGDSIRPFCTLTEATFLKRHFVPHPTRQGVVCGALDKAKATDVANWIHKSDDEISATKEAVCQCLMLSFGWGPTYFNEIRGALLKAWRGKYRNHPIDLRTWAEIDAIYYDSALEFKADSRYEWYRDMCEKFNK